MLIIPYEYEYRNGKNKINKRIINQINRINQIVNMGAAVIINSVNHAKYVLTDKDCFVGSNNLTSGGIENNVENSHFMYNQSGYYEIWKDQILKYLEIEIRGFASLEKLEKEENILNCIQINEINDSIVEKEDLIFLIRNIEFLMTAIYRVNDCYQHIDENVNKLIFETCPILKGTDILKQKLEDIYMNLNSEYQKKRHHQAIYIKKIDLHRINSLINYIKIDLQTLQLYRFELFNMYKDTWRTEQSIYKYLEEKIASENFINLRNFINKVQI